MGDAGPKRKVGAGALAGALSVLLVLILSYANIEIPPAGAAALTTVITFIVSYWVSDDEDPPPSRLVRSPYEGYP